MTPTNESTGIELEKRILRGELQDIPNAARLFIYERLSELNGTTKELELYKGLKRIITSQVRLILLNKFFL